MGFFQIHNFFFFLRGYFFLRGSGVQGTGSRFVAVKFFHSPP